MNVKELNKLKLKKELLSPIYDEFKNRYMEIELINPKVLEKTMDEVIESRGLKKKESEQARNLFKVWMDTVLTIGLNKTTELFDEVIFV